jgi:hypothetical protein
MGKSHTSIASVSSPATQKTVLIGDILISNVQSSDLTGKCTLRKINIHDYAELSHIITKEKPFKKYIIVLSDQVENEEVSKIDRLIRTKYPTAKIYMAEPLNLKTMEQRHSFFNLCYKLKLRVIPTGKLRDESTGFPDERLFHKKDASLNKEGVTRFLTTVAQYVPHWAEALPYHY